jgi:ATP-dependent RNA helicase DeaD
MTSAGRRRVGSAGNGWRGCWVLTETWNRRSTAAERGARARGPARGERAQRGRGGREPAELAGGAAWRRTGRRGGRCRRRGGPSTGSGGAWRASGRTGARTDAAVRPAGGAPRGGRPSAPDPGYGGGGRRWTRRCEAGTVDCASEARGRRLVGGSFGNNGLGPRELMAQIVALPLMDQAECFRYLTCDTGPMLALFFFQKC